MRVQQPIFTYNGFTCKITVTDNESTAYPKFVKTAGYDKSTSVIDYSVYLNMSLFMTIINDDDKEEKINEHFSVSFYDMYEVKKKLQKLLSMLEDEFYEESEHIDRGTVLSIKEEYRFPIVITNSTKKNQIGFLPVIVYNHKNDIYIPRIKVLINRDDVGVNLPLDKITAIVYNLLHIDLHAYAMSIINATYASKAYNKKLISESQKAVTIT